jgi:hypothetical protein
MNSPYLKKGGSRGEVPSLWGLNQAKRKVLKVPLFKGDLGRSGCKTAQPITYVYTVACEERGAEVSFTGEGEKVKSWS